MFDFLALWFNCPLQLKKLVYVYLVRYAEEQQDLALLSISTFQRALKVTSVMLLSMFSVLLWFHVISINSYCGTLNDTGLHVTADFNDLLNHSSSLEDTLSHIDTLFFFSPLFQDPNQFIRASALRVLSSIRVPIIVPIMMLAIKEAAADLSPYVRKTSAHAIQKLYR